MTDIEPRQLFLARVWYPPSEDENPVSLLGEQLMALFLCSSAKAISHIGESQTCYLLVV